MSAALAGRPRVPWRTLAALALVMAAILVPGDGTPRPPDPLHRDKLAHFCLFALLAVMAHADLGLDSRKAALLGFLAAAALAVGTELLQLLVPNRSTEAADAIADLAGYLCGWLARRPAVSLLTKATRRA